MNSRDWRQIAAELEATMPRTSGEPMVESAIPRGAAARTSTPDSDAVLDQIAKALRPSED